METGWFAHRTAEVVAPPGGLRAAQAIRSAEWVIQSALPTRILRGTPGSAGERMPDDDFGLVDLLGRVARGDLEAFAAFYDATSRRVFGLARSVLGDPEEAEEAALECYLHVWRHAARYDPSRGGPLQWLLVITRSRAIDRVRARVQRRQREQCWNDFADLEDARPGPEQACSVAEERSQVREALALLPKEQREAIELTYFKGLSHSEAAAVLGQPLGTVKSRIRGGLSSLRRCSKG
jgi:RNA polymerase sigma-70 factor (ECF subfamily)